MNEADTEFLRADIVEMASRIAIMQSRCDHYINQWSEVCNENQVLINERDALKRHLSSLLARIHCDGGHYESAHSTDLAVEHADVKVAVAYSNVHELLVRIVALEKERDAYAAAADDMAASHKIERDALTNAARLALDVVKTAQGNIASSRPGGSSDAYDGDYDHDAFMWDYYGNAIDALKAVL